MSEASSNVMDVDSSGQDEERLARAISAFVRAEFKAPVDVVASFIDLIIEDATREGLSAYRADLDTMKRASLRLGQTVSQLLDAAVSRQSIAERQLAPFTIELRHELRTPITAIMGYGELLLEEAREEGLTSLLQTLEAMLAASRRLLDGIDSMIDFIHAGALAPDHPAVSAAQPNGVLERAMSTLRSIFAEQPSPEARATGYILVIDDNPSSLALLTHRLERDGHSVCSCSDGESALRATVTEDFDLVLIDLLMPGINGIEVLRRLRSDPRTAQIPIVMMSGVDEIGGAARCIEMGADDFLAKPFDPILLRVRLSAMLERKFLRDRERARVEQLRLEREKSERLLRTLLPRPIIERLRQGERAIADHYPAATILFCDLVGFTAIASRLNAAGTAALLNTVFSNLDHLTSLYGLEKIKTIGDAYMLAGGLPQAMADHVRAVTDMALRIPEAVAIAGRECGEPLDIRIGLHTGPVMAGIIGTDKFVYDVWGDTVNIASRMERTGAPGRVHISAEVRDALGPNYDCEPLTPLHIKGKGVMQTFLLI